MTHPSDSYIEWDGTEACLENLLIWWGTLWPFEHSDDCDANSRETTLHCCGGQPRSPEAYRFSLESFDDCVARYEPKELPLVFGKDGVKKKVNIGDRFYFRNGEIEVVETENSIPGFECPVHKEVHLGIGPYLCKYTGQHT
jgi:hypothetical protein